MASEVGRGARGRGRPAMTAGADTRQRILHAARAVFSEVGYQSATFREIAARADLTRPAVNHYFRDKTELYTALFEATRDEVVAAGIDQASEQPTLAARISSFLATAVHADSSDRSYAQFISSSLLDSVRHPEFQERALGQLDELRGFLGETLHSAADRGVLPPGTDIEAVTEMLIAVMWGMGLYAGFVGSHDDLESVVAQFTKLLEGNGW
ncbi:TetR/AcrR family transcriptional regulator [Nocardia sp. NPDC059239]|uniref:TetR/AcrR family transcriptional regulator n=1 Tax=unclassified Nocardia TaxID=2637762 RepID=UPI0036A91775